MHRGPRVEDGGAALPMVRLPHGDPHCPGQIQVSVLLAHGTSDPVVPVDQSQTLAKALRRANKPRRFIEFDQGDHQLSRYTDRLAFFKALEAFLDEHLQPGESAILKQ